MQSVKNFEFENNLTSKQIELFKQNYAVEGAFVVQIESPVTSQKYTHFAISKLLKENINDFCVFFHKEDDRDKGLTYIAPCHNIQQNGINILVFECGINLPVKARPINLLFNDISHDVLSLLMKFFCYE